ncbi:PepSY domain-containing protein [Pusillimonas sp. TS35]|uniref:PepSY-associated TM helix domain-containing protein n=1 Tax=Paracandidimonas lactea TaxID=2895524 RepID=UPI00136CF0AA|nr:PepSY-associated TM helix domain-containing protein [Paracandidimonas lactea]MYN12510.1 PepSY domain-containing protein [Pusillimonas sp. TS35]
MRADVIRLYKTLHTWTGIVAGMALFIAFYAGAFTVFKAPLARWASPPAPAQLVPLADAPALIHRTLAAHPEAARGFTLHLKPTEHQPARLTWEVHLDDADGHDPRFMRHYAAALDAEGTVRVHEAHPSMLAETIDVLHRVVGLPIDSDANRWVMGVVAMLYALALVSGVVVLLPTLVKDFFALRLGKNLKRMWLDAHNVVGIVSLPFHIVMALTAAVFAFHDGIYAAQDPLFHHGQLYSAFRAGPPHAANSAPRNPALMLPPEGLVERARAVSSTFEPESLHYAQVAGPGALVRIWGHDATGISPRAAGGFIALDPYSGEVRTTDYMPNRQSAAHATLSSFFALHFATFGGTAVRWMYFVLALAGAWLFYSGNLLWIESRRKLRRPGGTLPEQRRDARLMAAGTVGVCLGCVCGISLMVASAKWLHGWVVDLTLWHMAVYYAGFFACVAWAFLRGGARASVDLLRAAACVTLAIPFTTLLAWAIPALGWWASSTPAALGVDITALAMGLGYLALAHAAAARARRGVPDSVWSPPDRGDEADKEPGTVIIRG